MERCDFVASARGSEGESTMMRNFRGSVLIALMLIVAWATTSEACCWRRARSCGHRNYNSCGGYSSGAITGLPRATTEAGATTPGIIRADTPNQVTPAASQVTTAASQGTTSAGRATTRAVSVGRRPESGCGRALAPAASVRGAERPQVLRSPRGRTPGVDVRADSGRCRRQSTDGRRGRLLRGLRQVTRLELQPVRPGVTSGDDPAILLAR